MNWYTQLRSEEWRMADCSRASSEPSGGNIYIDEAYRDKLSRKLRPSLVAETLLSVDYLNLYLRLYFRWFHVISPVVHQATFRPNSQNAPLFLPMCSIGNLFIGTLAAAPEGHKIFTRLNKAILASWDTHLTNTKGEALPMVQAALFGQTFGILSGKSNDFGHGRCISGYLTRMGSSSWSFHRSRSIYTIFAVKRRHVAPKLA